jgi:hypothetical protein
MMKRYDGGNIFVAADVSPELEKKASLTHLPGGWESGTRSRLKSLFDDPANATSQAVLARINAAGKRVFVIPETVPGQATAWAVKIEDATTQGEVRYANCKGGYDEADSSTWQRCQADPNVPKGTGQGSDVIFEFTGENYPVAPGPGSNYDEVALHELVHAVRELYGVFNQGPMRVISNGSNKLIFGSIEEFIAILVTNIYHSENGRADLRADHFFRGQYRSLVKPLTDPQEFYKAYKAEIDSLRTQKAMGDLFKDLAQIKCPFNPIWHAVYKPNG